MQFISTSLFLSAVLGLVGAAPLANDAIPAVTDAKGFTTLLGPASYDDLKAQVDALQSVERRELSKRAVGGLYLCENWDFQGSCYYGVYPLGQQIVVDQWWSTRISSAGPDQGTKCDFSNTVPCYGQPGGAYELFSYPGGNFGSLNDRVACFACYSA